MSLHRIQSEEARPVTPEEYHAIGADVQPGDPRKVMSRSALANFDECPLKWILGDGRETTKAMEWGSLMDARVTSPETLAQFAVAPETYPAKENAKKDAPMVQKAWNMNATFCKDWWAEQEAAGLTPIDSKTWARSKTAVAALDRDRTAREFLAACDFQVQAMAEWHDVATGLVVPVKCLLDLAPRNSRYLGDFKTTNDASERPWKKRVMEDGLHTQAALYMDVFNIATGEKRDSFRHLIQESKAPYIVGRRLLSEEFLQLGRMTYRRQLERYCRCLQSNTWPDLDTEEGLGGMIVDGFRLVEPEPWMIAA